MPARPTISLLAASLLLTACGSNSHWIARSKEYFSRGEFEQAWFSLQVARHEGEDAEEIERLYWPYRQAFLLKRAQIRVFANEDALALEDLAKVLAVDPDNRIAKLWARKAKDKLALNAADRGDSSRFGGDLEAALMAYHEALTFVPGLPQAEEGVQKVAEEWQQRRDKAQQRYLEGVRTLAEQLFAQTRYHMLIALDSDPTLEVAERSRELAVQRLNEQRFQRAQEMEKEGFYSAALREYRSIAEDSPGLGGLDEHIAATEREIEAAKLAREGEMAMFRGEYEAAYELIDQAVELTESQQLRYQEMLLMTRERKFEDAYVIAKDCELQGELEDAVARYREIHAAIPDFLDVAGRLSNLEAAVAAGREAYEAGVEAEGAGDVDAAIERYAEAILHYPKIEDAAERLARLRASRS